MHDSKGYLLPASESMLKALYGAGGITQRSHFTGCMHMFDRLQGTQARGGKVFVNKGVGEEQSCGAQIPNPARQQTAGATNRGHMERRKREK